jgi:hypothetical protein
MKRRGVTHPFMTLPEEDGDGRVLVDPSWKNGEFGLLPPVMDWGPEERSLIIPANYVNTPPRPSVIHAELPKRSPIILADHVNPPQPPPGYRTDRPRSCVKFINHRGASDRHKPAELHTRRHHWYKKNKSDGWWYEMPDEINYCPPQ